MIVKPSELSVTGERADQGLNLYRIQSSYRVRSRRSLIKSKPTKRGGQNNRRKARIVVWRPKKKKMAFSKRE